MSWDPYAVGALSCLVLAQLPKMSRQCLNLTIFGALGLTAFHAQGLVLPFSIQLAIMASAILMHLPMLPRAAVVLMALWMLAYVSMLSHDQMYLFHQTQFCVAGSYLAYRVAIVMYTAVASATPTLFFSILANLMPAYSVSDSEFFRADNCPEEVAQHREKEFNALFKHWNGKWPECIRVSAYLSESFSDLRFASNNRVFFPFKRKLESWCDPCTVVESVDRMYITDADGHAMIDVSGSYGVNVCGYDMYKQFISEGWNMVKDTGCVLGPVHSLLQENIVMLKQISRKDEVSFHMSGTEAVMSAVRMCRFNTRKPLIVIFGGAYHGWWDGVQPTAGNERTAFDVLTLKDMNPMSLNVLRLRSYEIAAVVVNPLQAFHPNAPPPSDLVLASNTRDASDSTLAYKKWLVTLRELCTRLSIVLVFDEVYTGFRLAPGGAQEYFEVDADMVVYGKTLGGGMPNGIVCGPRSLMSRTDDNKPLRVAYVVGTFAAHPLLLGSMNCFLKWATSTQTRELYDAVRLDVQDWTKETNDILSKEFGGSAPLQLASYSTVWTMLFTRPGRYHWILQYYLKDEGLNLSWVGTGRLSFSLDFEREDLERVRDCIIRACHRMQEGGWWWHDEEAEKSAGLAIKLRLGKEVVLALLGFNNRD